MRVRALLQNLGWITLAGMAVGYATAQGGAERRGKSGDPSGAARGGGAMAVKPSEIPFSGWIGIAKRTWAEIGSDRVLAVAAGVTFYALLALFPAITALVSLYGLVADPQTMIGHLAAIERFLPAARPTFCATRSPASRKAAKRASASPSASAWRWRSGARTPA